MAANGFEALNEKYVRKCAPADLVVFSVHVRIPGFNVRIIIYIVYPLVKRYGIDVQDRVFPGMNTHQSDLQTDMLNRLAEKFAK